MRVTECWATLRAETVYAELLRAGSVLKPGDRAKLELLVPVETDDRCSTPCAYRKALATSRSDARLVLRLCHVHAVLILDLHDGASERPSNDEEAQPI